MAGLEGVVVGDDNNVVDAGWGEGLMVDSREGRDEIGMVGLSPLVGHLLMSRGDSDGIAF